MRNFDEIMKGLNGFLNLWDTMANEDISGEFRRWNEPLSYYWRAVRQGCHKGRFWRKITVQTSARVRVYPADAVLPADGFLPSANAVKTGSVWTLECVRADASPSPLPPSPPPLCCPHGRGAASARTRKEKEKKSFLVVVAGLEREKQFSIFGFRFSIPKIPELPELPALRGLRGQSYEKKKVFSA
jgi:hypothetical protein